ncbi:aminoglycoside 6-adenylyltransferase [Brevibacillus ruminantium]|uniref:Aminoglycoside 6-adenylyltransferase n=1 Tax=Brevibacillus ruminantium TaxID=2950604 RepID=A0ABY4WHC8_9BACL|nr:aminoglycoside 6-adenylyltransferase [Brevibacillus ruminantium]USG66560.1 aminoglycoside 6-adenylyltransferase [Brevibacillus ruminantium]
MRSEKEMLDLILGVAQKDERVRAVYMNGSRTNPHAPKDILRDYDIVYVVTETSSFLEEENWIHVFGELLMMQEPDKNDRAIGMDMDFTRSYTYLMLFTDGNRIDLRIETKESMLERYAHDTLTMPLLDKDNCLPALPAPTNTDYWVKKPTEPLYLGCCNEFWWCLQNVAKGIWRDELPYAKQMFEQVIRPRLHEMIAWWVGIQNDFQVSLGKMEKYMKAYLPETYWEMYKQTYSDSDYENMWNSVRTACELFRILAKDVAAHFRYPYNIQDDTNMTKYLTHIRDLP